MTSSPFTRLFLIFFNCYFSSSNNLYLLQVFSLEDGPGRKMWRNLRVPITIIHNRNKPDKTVDWLKYD
jgi:3-deoxy-D-manno-octulosonate 8-phosphate phosphatase KdsC-like HAD superfamily phosphatase